MACPSPNKLCSRLTENEVLEYLESHPVVVEDYLLTSAPESLIENVLRKKLLAEAGENYIASAKFESRNKRRRTTVYTDTGITAMSRKIIGSIKDDEIYERIYEMCLLIKTSIDSEYFHLLAVESTENILAKYEPDKGCTRFGKIGIDRIVASYVATEKVPLNLEHLCDDPRFPDGVGVDIFKRCHAISIPLFLECGTPYVIVEFIRHQGLSPFSTFQFELVNAVMTWVMACLQKMKLNKVNYLNVFNIITSECVYNFFNTRNNYVDCNWFHIEKQITKKLGFIFGIIYVKTI